MIVGTRTNDPSKVVQVNPDGLLHHTLVVGQSGSGKSYFVARLLEEIALCTSGRIVIVDPNGDFRSIHEKSPDIFSTFNNRFRELRKASGREIDYDDEETFSSSWRQRRFLHLYPNTIRLPESDPMVLHRRLVLHWDALDDDDKQFLLRSGGQPDPRTLLGLEACVDFARYYSTKSESWFGNDLRGLINAAEQFAARNLSLRQYEYAKDLKADDWFAVRAMLNDLLVKYTIWHSKHRESAARPRGLSDYVYGPFGEFAEESEEWWDILTIALDAARQADALLTVNTLLSRLWKGVKSAWRRAGRGASSDSRVPTFLVIDEAQNFAPANTINPLRRRITEQLVQIASEGRKYGIYLVLATQRPTKLHPELVPECENSCVLRVQSKLDTDFASSALGLNLQNAAMAPGFVTGQGLICGRWIDSEVEINGRFAPARTIVGGGGLPLSWKTRKGASKPYRIRNILTEVRTVVIEELRSSRNPITLVELAETVRAGCPEVDDNTWEGRGSFKGLLLSLGIPELRISPQPPGHAYLYGVHAEPFYGAEAGRVDSLTINDRLAGAPEELRMALAEIQRETAAPLLEEDTYRLLFEAIGDVLAGTPFNLTETSKAVRDLLAERDVYVGRGAVSYVLKGISWSGHRFDSDLPQDPQTLALAFSRQLLRSLDERTSIVGEVLIDAAAYCTGGLVSAEQLKIARAESSEGATARSSRTPQESPVSVPPLPEMGVSGIELEDQHTETILESEKLPSQSPAEVPLAIVGPDEEDPRSEEQSAANPTTPDGPSPPLRGSNGR